MFLCLNCGQTGCNSPVGSLIYNGSRQLNNNLKYIFKDFILKLLNKISENVFRDVLFEYHRAVVPFC